MTPVLAVDFGASSIRVCRVDLDARPLQVEVVHRVAHGPVDDGAGHLRWDWARLLEETERGLRLGLERGPAASIGVDTWGVDYGLLDAGGALVAPPFSYRDRRTSGWRDVVDRVGAARLYRTTGTQLQPFNTLFQLAAHDRQELGRAARVLLLPELVVHHLTGATLAERTSAGTTAMVDLATGSWSPGLCEVAGIDPGLLPPISPAGTAAGSWEGVPVHLVGGHDTASAVLATGPTFVSSGTWLLVGQERSDPVLDDAARAANFTNEAGALGGVRHLRNLAGSWLLEGCRPAWGDPPIESLLAGAAEVDAGAVATFDVADPRFLAPTDMLGEVTAAAGLDRSSPPPLVTRAVVESMAAGVAAVLDVLGGTDEVAVSGGWARTPLFLDAVARRAGRTVRPGPVEAAAIGNAMAQGIAIGRFAGAVDARTALAGRDGAPVEGRTERSFSSAGPPSARTRGMSTAEPAAPDPLTQHAAAMPDKPAIVDPDGPTVTFAELNRTVNRLANGILGLGIEPGERAVWCGPNSVEIVTFTHAARKANLVAVPGAYRFTPEELQYVVDNSDATLVVIDAEHAAKLEAVRDQLPKVREVIVFGGSPFDGARAWDDVVAAGGEEEPDPAGTSSGATMIYTSGTTGKPKGALRSGSDPAMVLALLQMLRLEPGNEVHITTGPMYHSGPLSWVGLTHTLGGTIILMRHFDAERWVDLVREHRVTNTFTAPTQLKRIVALPDEVLARADLSSMRSLVANAAPVPYSLKQEIVAKLGDHFLFEVYGSTELGVDAILEPEDQLRKPGSCGRPYGPVEVRILDEDGNEAPTGTPGELFVRTTAALDGYHRTDEKITDRNGWKSVGDVAYVDDEGYLYICDRKKDMIISGGVNIYPAEIEAVLHAHPDVMDAAVFGIPSDEWGESVHAVVQPRPGHTLDLASLEAHANEHLAGYKRPRSWEVRDSLPRTESGKLLKRVLRDEHWKDRTQKV